MHAHTHAVGSTTPDARLQIRNWLQILIADRKAHGYELTLQMIKAKQSNPIENTERILMSLLSTNVISTNFAHQDFSYHEGIKTIGQFGSAGLGFSKRTTPICFWYHPVLSQITAKMIEALNDSLTSLPTDPK